MKRATGLGELEVVAADDQLDDEEPGQQQVLHKHLAPARFFFGTALGGRICFKPSYLQEGFFLVKH